MFEFTSLTNYKLEIRSCTSDTGLSLPDATRHSVKSTADVLNLMKLGELNRIVSCTAMNSRSSRSHRSTIIVACSSICNIQYMLLLFSLKLIQYPDN